MLLLILSSFSLSAQRKLQSFEIKQYGLSIDQPFHSAKEFSTDSLGRLLFTNYSFDGVKFEKRQTEEGETVKIEEDGSEWRLIDQFNIKYITQDSTYEINTKKHFKYALVNVETDGNDKYLLTNLGIVHFRMKGKELKHIQNIPLNGEDSHNIVLQGDTLYIKKLSAISYVLTYDLSSEYISVKKKLSKLKSGIFYLKGNRLCLKSTQGYELFPSDHPYSKALQSANDYGITSYLYDSKNRLWIGKKENDRSHLYFSDHSEVFEDIYLPIENAVNIQKIYEDLHGSIWIGSRGGGILQIHEPSFQILNKKSGFLSNNIRCITQRMNGDILLTPVNNGIIIIKKDNAIDHSLGNSSILSIFIDHKDNLWFPAKKGVMIYKNNGDKLHYKKKDGLMSSAVQTIFQDSKNQIWVGTRKGVNLYQGNHFKAYAAPGVQEYDKVLAIREYEPLSYLIGFKSGRVFKFKEGIYEELNFPDAGLNTIFTDRFNNTWVCSENSGLYLFFNRQFVSVKGDNLPTSIKLVQDDLDGNLWGICEKNQMFRLKIEDVINQVSHPKITYFGTDEGVPMLAINNDIQPNSALLDDGRVIFPNIYGAILINPDKVDRPTKSFSTEFFYQDSLVNGAIKLKYGQNDFSLKLSTINIAPMSKIVYEYNIGQEWLTLSEESRIDINNLSKGSHTLQFRGKPFNGIWQEVNPIFVYVPPLIYQYPLFWFVLFLLVAGSIYLFVKWRTRIINQRNKFLSATVSQQTHEIEVEKNQLAASLKKQRELTRDLNFSQASKNRMYAQISHEFKSPLQAIKSHLSKTDGHIQPEEKQRINGNIDNLLGISNEIMELSRAESGIIKIKKNWYNINGVIADQVELKSQLAYDKNVSIIQPSQINKQYLEFDISLIQKVINNLLSNAIKFSPYGGEILISSKIERDKQIIEIKDEGSGIPTSEIEKVTLAYYQATNNTDAGTGIGLSLVKEILKTHESKLNISSQLGKGSTFGFELLRPKVSQKDIISNHINTSSLVTQLSKIIDPNKSIILAVDDSLDVLYFITQALSQNYYVIATENGEEALKALNTIEPVAIISDFNMPIMNGMELLKNVRQFPKYQALPFLFLTGSSSEETELQTIKAGADIILQKPIQEDMLVTMLSQLLKRQNNIAASIKSSFAHDLLPTNIHNDDLIIMQKLESIFLENIDNGKLKSKEVAEMIGLGEKTLRNRVKSISGKTIKEYFRNFRLEKAKLLLDEGFGTMGEVAIVTGFSSLSYFSKSYKAYFNKNASR
ncbi:MAG: signal transduction histidine kinase/DNA-binding response OmpR family regulator [Saprospiraceae bacterium]|jgi:signal transduction histidine kinase/DNA-binding response OmpR family regulator